MALISLCPSRNPELHLGPNPPFSIRGCNLLQPQHSRACGLKLRILASRVPGVLYHVTAY